MIINKNGTKISPNEIEYFVRGYTSIFLYIMYSKGSEDGVTLTFKVKNKNVDDNYYTLVTGSPINLHPFKYTIKESGNIVLQCPIPEDTHYCSVSFEYDGGMESLHGDVTVSVTVNTLKF